MAKWEVVVSALVSAETMVEVEAETGNEAAELALRKLDNAVWDVDYAPEMKGLVVVEVSGGPDSEGEEEDD